ncbi:glycoside hydrolase family 43 protein [Pedobacter arcticus]|uniref:glycoside hydrolase family 43 protein n=1 Tax=Pedobacter arcticus TaxID=752140 RepID=UPI00036CB26D|nr:glycoside hydrolase family 43 protein [Pedobacter arcticus]
MKKVLMIFTLFFLCLAGVKAQVFNSGTAWLDTNGQPINAHGGGILYQKGTYYWYGEFKGSGKDGNKAKHGVSCYSSKDLKNWKNEGLVLKVVNDTSSKLQIGCVIERPKVIYNHSTRKYAMWFHHELKDQAYKAALTGLAIADKPTGPFTYVKSLRPNNNYWPVNYPDSLKKPLANLDTPGESYKYRKSNGDLVRRDFEGGQMARDMTLYVDDDRTAYHIAASEENGTLHISKLSPDYQSFTGEYYRVRPGESNEAPAIVKHQNKYYLITSGTTGWDPNPARAFVADKITGPYKSLGNPAVGTNEEKATTFQAQGTYILPVQGKRETYVFMADRWKPKNPIDGTYVWLPLTFENSKPVIKMFE